MTLRALAPAASFANDSLLLSFFHNFLLFSALQTRRLHSRPLHPCTYMYMYIPIGSQDFRETNADFNLTIFEKVSRCTFPLISLSPSSRVVCRSPLQLSPNFFGQCVKKSVKNLFFFAIIQLKKLTRFNFF